MNVTHSKSQAKKGLRHLCLAICITLLTAVFFPASASAEIGKTYSDPIDLGSPMQSVAIYDGAFGIQDGREVIYTTVSGKPAIFHVIDLKTKEVLSTHPLTGSESSWTHLTTPDGTVYIGGNGTLYTYSPVTKQLKNLGASVSRLCTACLTMNRAVSTSVLTRMRKRADTIQLQGK